jgi:hypothetical protein
MLDHTREQTPGLFGANFIMRFVDSDLAHLVIRAAAQHAKVVECFYTDPNPLLIETMVSLSVSWQIPGTVTATLF